MNCDELRDDYELYALGLADERERDEIRAHLDRHCENCSAGLRQARSLMTAIATTAPPAKPPARLRARILASVSAPRRQLGWPVAWVVTSLLGLFAAVYFSGRERQYTEETILLRRQLGQQAATLTRWNEAFAILNAPETTQVTFGSGQPRPPKGRVFLNPTRGVVLIAQNLPPAPATKIYEMWLIPKGAPPIPAGLFQSAADGAAIHVKSGPVDVSTGTAIAVTLEDQGGALRPTSTPLFVAPITGSLP